MKVSNTKRVGQAITLALVGSLIFTGIYGYTYQAKLEAEHSKQRQQLEQRQTEIKQLLDDKQQKTKTEQELKKELERLQKELQAKKAREARALAQKPVKKPSTAVRTPITYSGNKQTWLQASGIPQNEWWAVDYIVSREASWNPNAVNKSSGACSLAQALPCSKIPGDWRNPVNALKWQYQYVKARYGGYPQAVAFWKANHWY